MKKLASLIFILLVSTSLFALDCNLSLGYQDKNTNTFKHAPIYVGINVWQDFNSFQLYGNYTNEMDFTDTWEFSPTQDYFTVGASYSFEYVSFKLEHMCQHPVVVWNNYDGINGGYTKFEITIGDKKCQK